MVGGVKATDVHLTLLGLGAFVSEDVLEDPVHIAITKGLTSATYLRKGLEAHAGRERKGTQTIRSVLKDVEKAGGVPLNARVPAVSVTEKGPAPVADPPVRDRRHGWVGGSARLRFSRAKVVIEAFRFRWHRSKEQGLQDARRRTRLGAMGWIVLDIAWEDLVQTHEVIGRIERALGVVALRA